MSASPVSAPPVIGIAPRTARAMAAHWDGRADRFQEAPSHLKHRDAWTAVFASAVGFGPGRAIDLGCGTGACALALAELGYAVTGVDGSAGMLAHAKRDAASRRLAVEFLRSDMDGLDLPDGSADLVTLRNVLWTLERPQAAIALAVRLLKPGGTLLVSDGLWRSGENVSETEFGTRLPHYNGLAEEEVRAWLTEAGVSDARSWQHLFDDHPYGRRYDTQDDADLIPFFVLTARTRPQPAPALKIRGLAG